MSSEETVEENEENKEEEVEEVEDNEEEAEEVEETESEEESESTPDEGPYIMYQIPVEEVNGVITPVYNEDTRGTVHMHHTSPHGRFIIQTQKTPQYHRDDVNVICRELDKDEVLETGNKVRRFV